MIILSIDPGLIHAGWAISEYDPNTDILTVKDFGTIESTRQADLKAYREYVNKFGRRVMSLSVAKEKILEICDKYQPDYIESENAFFNPFRPSAFTALNDFIAVIRFAIKEHIDKPFYLISPKSIKAAISDGAAEKQDITKAVLKNKHIVFATKCKPTEEHEWDSIAGAYSLVRLYLNHVINDMPYDDIIASQKVKHGKRNKKNEKSK